MKYKALMCDVDGTLIPNKFHGMPSEKVIQAIAKASKLLHVGVATSRPLFVLKHITDKLNLSGPSIINAGAEIIVFPSGKTIKEHTISPADIEIIIPLLEKSKHEYFFTDGLADRKMHELKTGTKVLAFYAAGLTHNEVLEITNQLSHLSFIVVHQIPSWTKGFDVNITNSEATKQHGIYEVAKILGIETHEIIGIGDGHNDFPLLMACGLKIAMGNAVEDLKAIADYIAPTVEDDGVADVIEKFILKQ